MCRRIAAVSARCSCISVFSHYCRCACHDTNDFQDTHDIIKIVSTTNHGLIRFALRHPRPHFSLVSLAFRSGVVRVYYWKGRLADLSYKLAHLTYSFIATLYVIVRTLTPLVGPHVLSRYSRPTNPLPVFGYASPSPEKVQLRSAQRFQCWLGGLAVSLPHSGSPPYSPVYSQLSSISPLQPCGSGRSSL